LAIRSTSGIIAAFTVTLCICCLFSCGEKECRPGDCWGDCGECNYWEICGEDGRCQRKCQDPPLLLLCPQDNSCHACCVNDCYEWECCDLDVGCVVCTKENQACSQDDGCCCHGLYCCLTTQRCEQYPEVCPGVECPAGEQINPKPWAGGSFNPDTCQIEGADCSCVPIP
jgi:hypothetical protein